MIFHKVVIGKRLFLEFAVVVGAYDLHIIQHLLDHLVVGDYAGVIAHRTLLQVLEALFAKDRCLALSA